MAPICIYHGNCADGFGAAWAVRDALGADEVEFYPGTYQDAPPDVTGRDVILVDFSYKRAVLAEMAASARSILILDHHKSAAEDLDGIPPPAGDWSAHLRDAAAQDPLQMVFPSYVRGIFDMERSGAALAWDYFHPGAPRPALIEHIQDRDLWRFRLDGTREIQAAVFSHPYDFDVWDKLMAADLGALRAEGAAIERKHFKDIDELAGVVVREMEIGGHRILAANVPYTLTSDMGHRLASGRAFAACYWDTPDGRVFSLRSTDEGADVSAIAAAFGGGGHRNAAGFRLSYAAAAAFEVSGGDK